MRSQLTSANGRSLRIAAVHRYEFERQERVDLACSPTRPTRPACCAFLPFIDTI